MLDVAKGWGVGRNRPSYEKERFSSYVFAGTTIANPPPTYRTLIRLRNDSADRNTPQVRLQQDYSGHATQLVGAGHSSTCMVGIASLRV